MMGHTTDPSAGSTGLADSGGSGTRLTGMQPFERARLKIELAFGLLVRGAAQPGRIIDRVGAEFGESLFFRDTPRYPCAGLVGTGREPDALRCRIGIDDVVGTGMAFERHCRRRGCVL